MSIKSAIQDQQQLSASPINVSSLESHGGLRLSPASWAAIGGITKWVGTQTAGGIVGAAGGMLFNAFLDAVGLGGPDLVAKLDKISDQITAVQRSLDRLTEMTAEILRQLNELRDFMEKSLKIETLLTAMARIDVAYGRASSETLLLSDVAGRPISLRLLTEKMPHFDGITPQDLAAAATDFATYVSDIPDCIESIRRVLVQAAFGQTSLLTYWSKELGQQLRAGKISRESAYLVLEGYFLYAVSMQLKGLCVHCVALSTNRLGPQFIKQYLQEDFALLMREETSAYTEAVEHLIFASLDPIMLTGMKEMDEREFPKHVDEILLRTDLLCAALNLVGHKPGPDGSFVPSLQVAIQGIYGRSLLRPSDLQNAKAPALDLNGYAPASPTGQRLLPFLCLDLVAPTGKAMLNDVSTSFATVVHYGWKFRSPIPPVGAPIDTRFRGAVAPAKYPVFGPDQPPVLASCILNGNPLFRGLPWKAQQDAKFTEFPGGNPHVTYSAQEYSSLRHPLTNGPGDVFQTSFKVANADKAHMAEHSYVTHRLFGYSGKSVKIRLWAHITAELNCTPRIDLNYGIGSSHQYEVLHRLRLRLPSGAENEFYNSAHSFGPNKSLNLEENLSWAPLNIRRSGAFSWDFDLTPGEYSLVLDNDTYFPEARRKYSGWQSTSLSFTLRAVTLEMIFP